MKPTPDRRDDFSVGGATREIGERGLLRFMLTSRPSALFGMVLLSLFAAVLGLGAPLFQKLFIDHLVGGESQAWSESWREQLGRFSLIDVNSPLAFLVAAFFCMVVSQWLSTASTWLGLRESLRLQEMISRAIYAKTLSLRSDQTEGQTVGETVSYYATDVPGSTAVVDQTIPLGAGVLFPLICAPLAVQWICGIPVGTTVVVMISLLSVSVLLSIRQARFFQVFKRLAADRTGLVNEWVQNIRLLRILGWTDSYEAKIFHKREEETVNRVKMVTNGQMMGAFGSSINFLLNLIAVVTLTQYKGAAATSGDYFALLWIFGVFLSRPFRQVPWIFTFTFDGLTSLRRLEKYLSKHRGSESHLAMAPDSTEETTSLGRDFDPRLGLDVQGLRLSINGRTLLHDVSFQVPAGQLYAVVGEVGSGKSLLLLSLLGETGAQLKSLRVGGQELVNHSAAVRREYFCFVPQEAFVMSASLRENVVFEYQASRDHDARVVAKLRRAQLEVSDPARAAVGSRQDDIVGGLETEIGERGVNLSGGQRQRVSLSRAAFLADPTSEVLPAVMPAVMPETETPGGARATESHDVGAEVKSVVSSAQLEKKPQPVLMLDDSLSAVDVETERKLMNELIFGEWGRRTRILITHRLSVLEHVDGILFLRDGRLDDVGRYRELLARNTAFREFVSSVLIEQTPSEDSSAPRPKPSSADGEGSWS
ncbi:MAG TPA: ABC transporter ATP-binding protein [Pseudobdellovibrionaceae bacterium]|nr:ABC transporter ATP-binding protein [Pseudobdellovibrionaceae bacterium]